MKCEAGLSTNTMTRVLLRFDKSDQLSPRQRTILRTAWRREAEAGTETPVEFSEAEISDIVEKLNQTSRLWGTQKRLRALEEDHFRAGVKRRIILDTLKEESANSSYLSFFVCRDPVEKLVSVYNYLIDIFSWRRGSGEDSRLF